MNWRLALFTGAAAASLAQAACSEPPPGAQADRPAATRAAAAQAAAPVAPPAPAPVVASTSPQAQAVDAATFLAPPAPGATPADPEAQKRMLIRAQVMLDRAHFSPGVIDGRTGENVRQAVAAFEQARGLPVDGQLDEQVWAALTAVDAQPALQDYEITAEDVAGPFARTIPTDVAEMAKLQKLSYTSPAELLAEKFHMDERLLKALNPNVDFSKAGTKIVVAAVAGRPLPAKVARIEVDKAEREVRAYAADETLLAVYPATVGSAERPAPTGEWEVRAIAPNPTWTFDPTRLTFGKEKKKLTIAAGPNNPVGVMWIDLTKETYGIHGTPEPAKVGKLQSHGCVRLTNWDVRQLGAAVQKGTKVAFVGAESTAGKKT